MCFSASMEKNLVEWILFFHHLDSWDWPYLINLGGKHICPRVYVTHLIPTYVFNLFVLFITYLYYYYT